MNTSMPSLKPVRNDHPESTICTETASSMKTGTCYPPSNPTVPTLGTAPQPLRGQDLPASLIRQLVYAHSLMPDLALSSSVAVGGLRDGDTTKPKGASAGVCHEHSTTPPYSAISTSTWQWLVDSYNYQQHTPLMKTDVFLAPAVDDDEFVAKAAASLSSSAYWAPTPCLSPVTSPSDFLCDHEPLFDGIQDLQQATDDSLSDDEPDAPDFKQQPPDTQKPDADTSTLGWEDLMEDDDFLSTLPTPSQSASEMNSVIGDDEHDHDEGDEGDEDEDDDDDGLSEVNDIENKPIDNTDDNQDDDDTSDTDDSISPRMRTDALKRKRGRDRGRGRWMDKEQRDGSLQSLYLRFPDLYFESKSEKLKRAVTKRRTKKHPGRRPRARVLPANTLSVDQHDDSRYTIFEKLTLAGIDWCRYCGTTEGVNWRPGPWGKRTLCNKHGCDYKGYGIASRLPRLDLSAFSNERLEDRRRPVVQQFCVVCQSSESTPDNQLVPCEGGCSRAYHQLCKTPTITNDCLDQQQLWCCNAICLENRKRNKVGPYDAHLYSVSKIHANTR